jgi:hypothetical protein
LAHSNQKSNIAEGELNSAVFVQILLHSISTMRFQVQLSFLALAVATGSAYVPKSLQGLRLPLVNPSVLSHTSYTTSLQCPTRSASALSMGMMEEFVTGRDDATRKEGNDKYLAEVETRVKRINALEPQIEELGDNELQAKTQEFRARLKSGEDLNGPLLEEAFAVVRESAW